MALTKISTDGVKDDAVTAGKIPANAVGSSELADNAVDTNAIQDQAVALSKLPHGDSNNNGKFLRANNGADPTFETITGTTINNNADNRVITGSGTANTLNGESGLTFDGTDVVAIGTATSGSYDGNQKLRIGRASDCNIAIRTTGNTTAHTGISFGDDDSSEAGFIKYYHTDNSLRIQTNASERLRIDSSGKVGIGETNPTRDFVLKNSGSNCQLSITSGTSNSAYLNFGDTDDDNIGGIYYDNSNNRIVFRANTTDIVRMESDGNIRILDGNLRIATAGHGIDFSATSDASGMSSELLDDYEEGTWTPDLTRWTGSAWWSNTWDTAPTTNIGLYRKIGSVVYVTFDIAGFDVGSATDGRYAGMNGLPFAAISINGNAGHLDILYAASVFGTDSATSFWVSNGGTTTTTTMYGNDSGSHNTYQSGSGKRLRGQGYYFTN